MFAPRPALSAATLTEARHMTRADQVIHDNGFGGAILINTRFLADVARILEVSPVSPTLRIRDLAHAVILGKLQPL